MSRATAGPAAAPKPGRTAHERRARPWIVPACLAAALVGFVATQYPGALQFPLMTDDYLILAKVRDASFLSLWSRADLLSGYYRPWARELHYWALLHLFGPRPLPFHLACFMLWFGIMALYFVLVRRLAGTAAATLATCLATTQAPWGVLLIWSAGSQDLWMMALGLLALVMFASGRIVWAAAALALSLLSKETAATLPAIATVYALTVERRPVRATLRRTAPLWAVVAAWALVHPLVGGRPWAGSLTASPPQAWDGFAKLGASLRETVNAGFVPRPADGWRQVVLSAWPSAALVGATVLVSLRSGAKAGKRTDGPRAELARPWRAAAWAASWALLGWLPLLMPGIGWQPYYALWGGFGLWCAVAIGLSRWRVLAVVAVVGLSFLRTAAAWTPQVNLGSEWYQSHSAAFTDAVRRYLLEHHTSLPAHSRVFLAGVPGGVGLIPNAGHCPALEVWYGDATLRGYFYSQYTPRAARDTLGRDFFFVFDSTGHSAEIVRGNEDLVRARAEPDWLPRHMELASLLFSKDDGAGCADELEKMTRAFPEEPSLLFDLGACRESLGDLEGARACYRKALALPGANEEMLAIARRDWISAP